MSLVDTFYLNALRNSREEEGRKDTFHFSKATPGWLWVNYHKRPQTQLKSICFNDDHISGKLEVPACQVMGKGGIISGGWGPNSSHRQKSTYKQKPVREIDFSLPSASGQGENNPGARTERGSPDWCEKIQHPWSRNTAKPPVPSTGKGYMKVLNSREVEEWGMFGQTDQCPVPNTSSTTFGAHSWIHFWLWKGYAHEWKHLGGQQNKSPPEVI